MGNVDVLKEYFSNWRTPAGWDYLEAPVERYFHPRFVLANPDGEMSRSQWIAKLEEFARGGLTVEVLSASQTDSGGVLYHNRLTLSDGRSMEGYGLAEFENGQRLRMTPQDELAFSKLLDAASQ